MVNEYVLIVLDVELVHLLELIVEEVYRLPKLHIYLVELVVIVIEQDNVELNKHFVQVLLHDYWNL